MPKKPIYHYTLTDSDGIVHSGTAPELSKIFGVQIDTVYARIRRGGLTAEQIFGVEPLPKSQPKPRKRKETKPGSGVKTTPVKDVSVCRTCRYWSFMAGTSSTHYCIYAAETEKIPKGYIDEYGRWHREPGPCAEYAAGKFRSEYNFVHRDPRFKPDGKC